MTLCQVKQCHAHVSLFCLRDIARAIVELYCLAARADTTGTGLQESVGSVRYALLRSMLTCCLICKSTVSARPAAVSVDLSDSGAAGKGENLPFMLLHLRFDAGRGLTHSQAVGRSWTGNTLEPSRWCYHPDF